MIKALLRTMKRGRQARALVLMYHRVAGLEQDLWRLAVKPRHFEQHLQVLSRNWRVVPLPDLVDDLARHRLRTNSIALTFDDGYRDNYTTARPLLEKHGLPATFFITSGNIGRTASFWWDELEYILLSAPELPARLRLRVNREELRADLGEERCLTEALRGKHRQWKAFVQEPPTRRGALYLSLWEQLKPLPGHRQQECLQQLRQWAGIPAQECPDSQSMRLEELQALARDSLFEIGAHTVSHPDLASLSPEDQQQELAGCKSFLEGATGRAVSLLAYPYGSCSQETVRIAEAAGYRAALTTAGTLVDPYACPYRLGRFLADDWSGEQLDHYLKAWLGA